MEKFETTIDSWYLLSLYLIIILLCIECVINNHNQLDIGYIFVAVLWCINFIYELILILKKRGKKDV